MNQSIETLFAEHETITSAIDLANRAAGIIGINDELYDKVTRQIIEFFRNYADGLHHQKEEEIFFPAMVRKNEFLGDGVLREMIENHENFRTMIKDTEGALNNKDYTLAGQNMKKYTEALLDHIAVENEEVFQMAESLFTEEELDKIHYRFEDSDREAGKEKKQEFAAALNKIKEEISRYT